MLRALRGRNVSHVGCALGLVLGLILGLFAAVGVIQFVVSSASVTLAVVALIVVTLGLGILGFVVGWLLSPHGSRAE